MPRPNKFTIPRQLRFKLLAVAGEAQCDPRTVFDYVSRRRNPRPAQCAAIERVLRDRGYTELLRTEGA